MSDELRGKLTQVEDDLRELRTDKAAKAKVRDTAKETYAAVPDDQDDSDAFEAAKLAVAAVGEIDEQVQTLTTKQVDLLKILGDTERAVKVETGARKIPQVPVGNAWGSAALLEDQEIRDQLQFISGTKSRFGSLELGEILDRDTLAGLVGGDKMHAANEDAGVTAFMREGRHRGVFPQLVRQLSLLNLIPTGTADGNTVPYTQEVGLLTGGGPVAEGEVKEQVDIAFEDADAPVRTIAAYMKLRKQVLSDYPALRSIMDTRLRYLVQRRLEEQILAGDGTGQNLEGLLEVDGTGTVGFNAAVPLNELVLSGITNVFLNEGAADGVVLHPIDWQHVVTEKAHNAGGDAGSYDYYGGGPYSSTPASLWGVPVVPAQALTQGQGLVADFALGVTLLIREGVNVLLSDSDQDDFIRNRVTILAEMRAALPIWRPSVIQKVELE